MIRFSGKCDLPELVPVFVQRHGMLGLHVVPHVVRLQLGLEREG